MMDKILRFDNDSKAFAYGFECGRIWALLSFRDPEALDGHLFHADNAEMVVRMLEETGMPLRAEFTADHEWMYFVPEDDER